MLHKHRHKCVRASALALMAGTLLSPAILHAQTDVDAGGQNGSDFDIVVTAQFREQNLQDTPIAITAVSGDMLEARSQTNIAEVANQAPSVTLRAGNANFGPSLAASIRGIGQHDFNPALEPGVGMYVDDVYYPTLTGSIFDLLDLERVEILRGPQGTLAGRNSIGGAIKLYSKRPEGTNSGSISATYGSRDRVDLRASADFGIAQGVDARISGVSRRQDGYVDRLDFGCVHPQGSPLNPTTGGIPSLFPTEDDCLVGRDGNVNYQAVRGQLRLRPTDTVDINIIADYSVDDRNSPAAVITDALNMNPAVRGEYVNVPYDERFVCGPFCNYGTNLAEADPANGFPYGRNFDGRSWFEGWGVSGQIDWNLSDDLRLVSITAYREYNAKFSTDDDLSPLPVSNMQSALDFRFFSQELRLNGSFADDAVEYTIGGYYSDQESVYAGSVDLRWAGLQFRQNDPVPAETKALFAHASWNVTDAFTLTGGIRYTEEEKTYTFHRYNLDGSPNPPLVGELDGQSGTYKGDRIDYRINAQYRWNDNLMTYAQFSTGFKGGGINPRPYNIEQVQPFDMETLNAWEVGLKSDFFDRRARLNLSGYFNQYKGIQRGLLSCPQFDPVWFDRETMGPWPCAMNGNAGDAEILGFEAELNLRPVDGLSIDGSVSYLDFSYTAIDPNASGPGGLQLDHIANYAAKWQWSIGAQYEIPLGDAGSLTPRIDASYKSSVYANAVNAPENLVPAYTLANARLTWRNADDDLQVSLEVTNLFDEYYYLNIFNVTGNGFLNAQPARPREWAVSVTKRF